ncbi:MAG: hypothetical protein JNL30_11385 [Rubrivivax sp.]|nr:hypothetical protein [Rubrivivax sp.]
MTGAALVTGRVRHERLRPMVHAFEQRGARDRDAAEELHEKLPLVGALMRGLERRLATPQR